MLQEAIEPIFRFFLHRRRDQAFERQKWGELAEVSRKLLAAQPLDYRALNDLSVALYGLRDYDGALAACEQAFKAAPKVRADLQFAAEGPRYMRYLSIYAKALVRKEELEKARRVLEQLKKMGLHFHDKYFLLSRVYKKQGMLALAAVQLEEMQRAYEKHTREWETTIRANSLAILERAVEKRDADAALFCIRTVVRSALHSGELEKTLAEAAGAPGAAVIKTGLEAFVTLLGKSLADTRALAARAGWPELERRFEVLVLMAEGRAEDAFRHLRELPPDSLFHLEQLRLLTSPALQASPAYFRDHARCHLLAGHLEEAHRSLIALTATGKAELGDLDSLKEVRKLLLERAIWEDEKRLGQHPDAEAELTARVLPSAPESVDLPFNAKTLRVRLSDAIRLGREDGGAPADEIRYRLAENYIRAGKGIDAALRHLQELSRGDSPYRFKAMALVARQLIRGDQAEAGRDAVKQFREVAPSPNRDELKSLYLELGEACEAAGLFEQAKELYGALLASDIDYADVKERLNSLKSAAQGQPHDSAIRQGKLRERFTDLTAIGRGGMGVVYRAFDPLFNRGVALKVLADRFQGDPDACQRFAREGQAMSQLLNHPGIIQIYEVGMHNEFYIAMELVTGGSLRALLREKKRLPPEEIRGIGKGVAAALGFAHRGGIHHRDVKPDNILFTDKGLPKLVDFGLADIASATVITKTGAVMGTGPYMAPEQIRGQKTDGRSDIYSLGIVLYEMAAGETPFQKGDLAYQHLNEPPKRPSLLAPGIPPPLEGLILRCLEKTPEKRFQTCEELEKALADG